MTDTSRDESVPIASPEALAEALGWGGDDPRDAVESYVTETLWHDTDAVIATLEGPPEAREIIVYVPELRTGVGITFPTTLDDLRAVIGEIDADIREAREAEDQQAERDDTGDEDDK